MFEKIKAKRWWEKFFRTASRQERRKVMRQARKMSRRKHRIWRGVDIEAGGLLLGKYYTRHGRTEMDREELVMVNLRNSNMGLIPGWQWIMLLKRKLKRIRIGSIVSGDGNTFDIKDYMTLEYKLPGKVYTILKLMLWHWKDIMKGRTVIGSWHGHPVGIQEPSEQDEKTAIEHKKILGIEVYFLGIEKGGNMKFWKY